MLFLSSSGLLEEDASEKEVARPLSGVVVSLGESPPPKKPPGSTSMGRVPRYLVAYPRSNTRSEPELSPEYDAQMGGGGPAGDGVATCIGVRHPGRWLLHWTKMRL